MNQTGLMFHELAKKASEILKEKSKVDELTEEEKRIIADYSFNGNRYYLIPGLTLDAAEEFSRKQMSLTKYAAMAAGEDIRTKEGVFSDSGTIAALDAAAALECGVDPNIFIHHCVHVNPKKDKQKFRDVFSKAVNDASSIIELARINSDDFRFIPGFQDDAGKKVVAVEGSPRLWFGKKDFYAYREAYMAKFRELAGKSTFNDLFEVQQAFKECFRKRAAAFRAEFEDVTPERAQMYRRSWYQEYKWYHAAKERSKRGLPVRWILPLDTKLMNEVLRLTWRKANFAECYGIYRKESYRELGDEILSHLSSLAKTADEHFIVASIAFTKGEKFRKMWRNHVRKAGR